MIELGDELNEGSVAGQVGYDARSLLSTISQSRFNYWAAYVVDFSCILLFGYLGLRHHPGWASDVVNFAFGVTVFTLIEYSIHRWLLHNPKCFFFALHDAHHKHPEETAAFLAQNKVRALAYHAGMSKEARDANQNSFMTEAGVVMKRRA